MSKPWIARKPKNLARREQPLTRPIAVVNDTFVVAQMMTRPMR